MRELGHPKVKNCFLWAGWGGGGSQRGGRDKKKNPNFNCFKLEGTGGKEKKKKIFEKMKKKVPVGPFRPTRPVHRK